MNVELCASGQPARAQVALYFVQDERSGTMTMAFACHQRVDPDLGHADSYDFFSCGLSRLQVFW